MLIFFFTKPAATEIYTLSLHDALPIYTACLQCLDSGALVPEPGGVALRSEEHTSELQSRFDLVCRLLLEKIKEDGLTVKFSGVTPIDDVTVSFAAGTCGLDGPDGAGKK